MSFSGNSNPVESKKGIEFGTCSRVPNLEKRMESSWDSPTEKENSLAELQSSMLSARDFWRLKEI